MKHKIPEPFYKITNELSISFNKELKKEMPNGHILKNEKFNCIAKRDDRDDYIFYISSLEKYAIVHLTWTKETDPYYPCTTIYNNFLDIDNLE